MLGNPTATAAIVAEWMLEASLGTTTAPDAFQGMITRLRDQGVQIDRAHIAYTTLHPLNRGIGATWTITNGMEVESYGFDRDQGAAGWYESPILHLIRTKSDSLRRRLAGPAAMLDFPVLERLAGEGLTDYLLNTQPFESFFVPIAVGPHHANPDEAGMAVSFATARPDGFTDEEISTLRWLVRPLAMMIKMADQRQIAMSLAECYIGHEAGPRVLGGAIRRGDYASTPAVVWLSDLRASTELSATLPREEFVATINEFFDCTVGAVEAEGGEPLTFIGDGALAIFPIDRLSETGARKAAWAAARRATRAMDDLNDRRREAGRVALDWGVALHAGMLDYGNIGSLTRHSWSVIGPVVNETARLEGLTKTLGARIVASAAFARGMDPPWRPVGKHALRGVKSEIEVCLPPEAEIVESA